MIVRINEFKSCIPSEYRELIGDDRYVRTGCASDKPVTIGKKSFEPVDMKNKLVTFVSSDSGIDRDGERIERGAFHGTIDSYKRAGAPVISSHLKWLESGMAPVAGMAAEMFTESEPFISIVKFAESVIGKDLWAVYSIGAMRGISVNFRAIDVVKENGIPVIKQAELIEQSLVVAPANPRAVAIDVVRGEIGNAALASRDDGEVRELKAAYEELLAVVNKNSAVVDQQSKRIKSLFGDSPDDTRSKALADDGGKLDHEGRSAVAELLSILDV